MGFCLVWASPLQNKRYKPYQTCPLTGHYFSSKKTRITGHEHVSVLFLFINVFWFGSFGIRNTYVLLLALELLNIIISYYHIMFEFL